MSIKNSEAVLKSVLSNTAHILRLADTVWVGFSGGLDSTVLLYLAKCAGYQVKALHVNHGLSINSNFWEERCKSFAKSLNVEFVAERVNVVADGAGLEAAARDQRYSVYKRYVAKNDVILLAHHADDQLETMVYRMMRSSGLKGLAGIRQIRHLSCTDVESGRLLRPFLPVSRRVILDYAKQRNLSWIEDESNSETQFDRNYLRLKISPLLAQRWPDAAVQAAKTARLVEDSLLLLQEYAQGDLAESDLRKERLGESICLISFKAFSTTRRHHVVRSWVERGGFSLPSRAHLVQLDQLIEAKEESIPEVKWGRCVFRRFQQRLYLHTLITPLEKRSRLWCGENEFQLPLGVLKMNAEGRGLKPGSYLVNFRQVGERCKPEGRAHSQTLKKLFQEYQVEPWLRDLVPILYSGKDIAAVGDLFICEGFVSNVGWQQQWLID